MDGKILLMQSGLRRNLKWVIMILKARHIKSIGRCKERGKLSLHYIRPFPILSKIGGSSYRLILPPQYNMMHDVLHVSLSRKYMKYPSHMLHREPLELKNGLSYEEVAIDILCNMHS